MIGFLEHPSAPVPGRHTHAAPTPQPLLHVHEHTASVFAPNGWLHTVLHLQHRPQQAAFADATARAFATGTPLLCEAGTGVGKSLAYLIPGIIHAVDTARQLVVATHTIPLQEQIQNNDLVKCRRLFENVPELNRYATFKTALLVGKSNYLCTTRLAKALQQHTQLLETAQQTELRLIQEWAETTQTGLREEFPGGISSEVWDWVNADSSACNPRNCTPATCPYQRARARIASANIVVVNHALLLALIAAGATPRRDLRGVLYPDDFVVLDEAHRLPDVATDHFGTCVTAIALDKQLRMLWNPRRNRGILASFGTRQDQDLVVDAMTAAEFFFNEIRHRHLAASPILRLRQPDWAEPLLNEPLQRLVLRLGALSKNETARARQEELDDFRRRLNALNGALNDILALAHAPEHVYWVERTGVRGQNIAVNSAPLDVADALRTHLFERKTSVLMTSATLSDGTGNMERFQKQTGATRIECLIEESPFDYRRNMQIYIAADAPAPDPGNGGRDTDWLAGVAAHCIAAVPHGGTLLLCTSHGDVRKLHTALSAHPDTRARALLAQLAGTNRSQLVGKFRTEGNAVLIGTDSFWTGVDVPGPALSQVIMVRLPFENPSHPIVEARMEWLQQKGKRPFDEMSLPAALIKFRQGLGRLIRKMDDRGRLVILDSRMLTKTYGRHFVAALPHPNFTRFTRENLARTMPEYT